jgi:hypothetical protein
VRNCDAMVLGGGSEVFLHALLELGAKLPTAA